MKKMLLIITIIIIILIVYIASIFVFRSSLVFNDIYGDIDFTNIEITNGDGHKIMPDMETTQEEVLSMLGDIQFTMDGIFFNQYPVLYNIKFLMGSMERRKGVCVLSGNSIAYGEFIYKSSDDSIDLEYLKKLFE